MQAFNGKSHLNTSKYRESPSAFPTRSVNITDTIIQQRPLVTIIREPGALREKNITLTEKEIKTLRKKVSDLGIFQPLLYKFLGHDKKINEAAKTQCESFFVFKFS